MIIKHVTKEELELELHDKMVATSASFFLCPAVAKELDKCEVILTTNPTACIELSKHHTDVRFFKCPRYNLSSLNIENKITFSDLMMLDDKQERRVQSDAYTFSWEPDTIWLLEENENSNMCRTCDNDDSVICYHIRESLRKGK